MAIGTQGSVHNRLNLHRTPYRWNITGLTWRLFVSSGRGGVLKETVVTNMKRETDPSKLNKALVDR